MKSVCNLSGIGRQILSKSRRFSTHLLKCGQPTAETHPHLLKSGEIIPSTRITEFQNRRQNLVDLITSKDANRKSHLIVIPSATKRYMSDKIPYVFRQNTDYLYLSGCLEPDSCLVIGTKPSGIDYCATLFVRNPDSQSELWDGPRTSAMDAPVLFGVEQSLPMDELQTFLRSYVVGNRNCTVWYDVLDALQPKVECTIQELIKNAPHVKCESPKRFIHQLRLFKSPSEIELMKKSCQIASEAINQTIAFSKPEFSEHQLFAKVDYECRMRGAEYLAYPPVVAGGDRATIIHYINNNQKVNDGEMILMDAGCECHGYSSDITRTWPVNGCFTPEQKLLYEIVYNVQQDLFKFLHEFPALDNLFDRMCIILGKYLQEIGFIPKNISSDLVVKNAYQFCPHHVSHYLGMDVHDTHSIPRNIKLQPGMIITVEPGIYITERHKVPKKFQGLGIRIEDDVLITQKGPVILTNQCIRELSEIENIKNQLQ